MSDSMFQPDVAWFDQVAPEGIPIGKTTVVSGPGGSGKPLIGLSVVDAWLNAGGSAVVLLTNSGREFIVETMAELYDTDLSAHADRLAWVDFDPEMDPDVAAIEEESSGLIRGNLLEPAVWTTTIQRASDQVPETELGTLVFGSALNLLLFSPTYGDALLETMADTAQAPSVGTALFTVSTSAFEEQIETVEAAADTVLLTDTDDQTLQLKGVRSDSGDISTGMIDVPFTESELDQIKTVAESTRQTLIPTIRGI